MIVPRPALLSTVAALAAAPILAGEAEVRATLADLARIRGAVETHRASVGALPTDGRGLGVAARLYAPSVPQRGGLPVDAWGHPFRYAPGAEAESPEGAPDFALYSFGPDGRDDGGRGDDLGRVPGVGMPREARRALEVFPVLVLVALAPLAWGLLRWARRRTS